MQYRNCFMFVLLVKISALVGYYMVYSDRTIVTQLVNTLPNDNVTSSNDDSFNDVLYDTECQKYRTFPGILNYTKYVAHKLNATPLIGVEPIFDAFTPVFNDVASFEYSIQIPPCIRPSTAGNEISLFIAIISAPKNREKRNVIRETWLEKLKNELNSKRNPSNSTVMISGFGFILGQTNEKSVSDAVSEESARHGDILLVDMVDYYFNLSIKVGGLFNWMDQYCRGVDYLLKLDDDVFVNVRNLGSLLPQLDPKKPYIYGTGGNRDVARDGRWKVGFEDYPWKTYPQFFLGPAILVSGNLIRPLLAAIQTIPYYFIDDVYLTGFCAEKAGAAHVIFPKILGYYIPGPVKSCDAQDFVTLLRGSVEHSRETHNVTELLYAGTALCVRKNGTLPEDPYEFHEYTLHIPK